MMIGKQCLPPPNLACLILMHIGLNVHKYFAIHQKLGCDPYGTTVWEPLPCRLPCLLGPPSSSQSLGRKVAAEMVVLGESKYNAGQIYQRFCGLDLAMVLMFYIPVLAPSPPPIPALLCKLHLPQPQKPWFSSPVPPGQPFCAFPMPLFPPFSYIIKHPLSCLRISFLLPKTCFYLKYTLKTKKA